LYYPNAKDRFGVVYALLNTATGERVFVKTYLNEPDLTIPSAVPLWRGADCLEREVYDMYGIEFAGHPDLRRILMPEEFTSFPLRKDYPLRGKLERHNFPVIGYLHSGFEKLGEDLDYNQYVTIVDRMNYISPFANEVSWHHAVEKLLGIELTPRCKYLRVLLAEFARITDHLLTVGAAALDL